MNITLIQCELGLVEATASNIQPRPEYSNLQSQLTKVTYKPLEIGSYTPSEVDTSCKPFNYQDQLYTTSMNTRVFLTNLPMKPNRQLCTCMIQSLHCVTSTSTSSELRHATRKKLCQQNPSWCGATYTDPVSGKSGSYVMCNVTEKESWVLDKLYRSSDNDRSACISSGGQIQQDIELSSHCKIFLDQAGPEGYGIVTHDIKAIQITDAGGDSFGTAAKIGIAIGVVGAIIITTGLVIWLRARRKRQILEMDNEQIDD
jgi:1,3-beta-glucanosyltransferase GAS1